MNLLAICVAVHDDCSFTVSRPCELVNRPGPDLLDAFIFEFGFPLESIETIIIVQNGEGDNSPVIMRQWSSANGDF